MESWFLEMDLVKVRECAFSPVSAQQRRIFDFVRRFVAERKAAQWLHRRVCEDGRVVSADELVHRYLSGFMVDAVDMDDLQLRPLRTRVSNRMRKWRTRFKRRRGVKLGVLPCWDPMPMAEVKEKAVCCCEFRLFQMV